jgi:hypothetical protein
MDTTRLLKSAPYFLKSANLQTNHMRPQRTVHWDISLAYLTLSGSMDIFALALMAMVYVNGSTLVDVRPGE